MYYAVIMAGGTGTRLWPLSREKFPKQALSLIDDKTMFQYAVDRLAPLFLPDKIFVVTSAEHVKVLSDQEPGIPEQNFIIEPEGRGTAPAIGLTVLHLLRKDPKAVMAVLTADHFIKDTNSFRDALDNACMVAEQDYLVTLGIQPTEASTAFGYIQQGDELTEINGQIVYRVSRFTEKPGYDEAQRMILSGEYSWNSGMFIWKADRIMAEFKRQMPEFYNQLNSIEAAWGSAHFDQKLQEIWAEVHKSTIDYGLMEGAKNVAVIPVDIGWADIGSWGSLYEVLTANEDGNVQTGEGLSINSKNNLVFGDKRFIATIGIEDLIIVDTEDALLICKRGQEQAVKTIVKTLKAQKRDSLV